MRRTGPARTRSRYQNPATLPGLRVEGMGPPLWEFSLRYGGGRQEISPHEQRRPVSTRRSEERTYPLRKVKPQRVDWIREKAPNADRVSFWLRTEAIGTEGALWFLLDVIFTPVGNKFRGWTGRQERREIRS